MSKEQVPHYALPNASTEAASYVNKEQDMVREGFQAGNFRNIATLPTEFRHGTVEGASASHVDANITSAIYHAPHGSYKVFGKNKIFQEFVYEPSEYNLADVLKSLDKKTQAEKQQLVSKQPFVYASTHAVENQRPVFDPEEEAKYADPYAAAKEARIRDQWLQQSKVLAGPFLPNTDKIMDNQHHDRGLLPDMMRCLATLIDTDWEDSEFQIYRDEQDLIIVEFDLESVDSEKGLLTYINNVITKNDELAVYALSKVPELWNHKTGEGTVYYALKPAWVTRANTQAYYTLHPERRNFTSLRNFMREKREEATTEETAEEK